MRLGWHVGLPGPFTVGGTIWRSKRRRFNRTCAIPTRFLAAVWGIAWAVALLSAEIRVTHGWAILAMLPALVLGLVWRYRPPAWATL